jgi:hypothetical protein
MLYGFQRRSELFWKRQANFPCQYRNPDRTVSSQSLYVYTDHNVLSTILADSHFLKQNAIYSTNRTDQNSKNNQLSDVTLCEC